jgi:hypothetical protein
VLHRQTTNKNQRDVLYRIEQVVTTTGAEIGIVFIVTKMAVERRGLSIRRGNQVKGRHDYEERNPVGVHSERKAIAAQAKEIGIPIAG